MSENLYQEVGEMRQTLSEVLGRLKAIEGALLGTEYDRQGLTAEVKDLRTTEQSILGKLNEVQQEQERRREAARNARLIALMLAPVGLVLAYFLMSILISDIRHQTGLSANEARIIGVLIFAAAASAIGYSAVNLFNND